MSYFGQFGAIQNVTIKYNAQTGHPRGFGFVTFTSDGSIDAVSFRQLAAGLPNALNLPTNLVAFSLSLPLSAQRY